MMNAGISTFSSTKFDYINQFVLGKVNLRIQEQFNIGINVLMAENST